jgi:hypothetical protein
MGAKGLNDKWTQSKKEPFSPDWKVWKLQLSKGLHPYSSCHKKMSN